MTTHAPWVFKLTSVPSAGCLSVPHACFLDAGRDAWRWTGHQGRGGAGRG